MSRAYNVILGGLLAAVLWLCTAGATAPPSGQRILPEGPWGDKIEQQWLELQRELASRHPNSTFIIARESGHNILFDQPDVIVAAVRKLLAGGAGKPR